MRAGVSARSVAAVVLLAGAVLALTYALASLVPAPRAPRHEVAASHDAVFIPTSDWLCAPKRCPVIIGNILGYRDDSHITSAAAALLSPYLELAVRAALSA
jgi:hypothetical protein